MVIQLLEDMKRMQDTLSLEFKLISKEYERRKEELDSQIKEVELREKELDQGQALNESEWKMLDNQKRENEMAKENIMRRAEEQKRGKELFLKKIMELEAKLHENQALLLQVFKDCHAKIYEKRMEELDREQFMNAVKVKYGSEDLEKAVELCSLWEGYLRDPSWQPYKVVMVGEKDEEVLDENDGKLKELKNEFGEEVYEVVTKALNKFNEYDPSDRYPVPVLWNASKKKRATLKEGVARLVNDLKIRKGKRKRN